VIHSLTFLGSSSWSSSCCRQVSGSHSKLTALSRVVCCKMWFIRNGFGFFVVKFIVLPTGVRQSCWNDTDREMKPVLLRICSSEISLGSNPAHLGVRPATYRLLQHGMLVNWYSVVKQSKRVNLCGSSVYHFDNYSGGVGSNPHPKWF
jgi:hypothetical protein